MKRLQFIVGAVLLGMIIALVWQRRGMNTMSVEIDALRNDLKTALARGLDDAPHRCPTQSERNGRNWS